MFAAKAILSRAAFPAHVIAERQRGHRIGILHSERSWPTSWTFAFLLAHGPLALALRSSRWLAAVHALFILGVGLAIVGRGRRDLALAQWLGYVVGAEVLWRMCQAPIPWEFAKLAIAFVCFLTLLGQRTVSGVWLPLLYVACLIPACALSVLKLPLNEAREALSFNMAGHVCLALIALCLSRVPLTSRGLNQVAIALLGPVTGMAFLVLVTMAASDLSFGDHSNFAASGGYGPNQVSAMFGLAGLMALFACLGNEQSGLLRAFLALLVLWFLGQAVLTFSRTGFYLFLASFLAGAVFLIGWKGRAKSLFAFGLVLGAAALVAAPWLDEFTDGQLAMRYADHGLTGRKAIAKMDVEVWLKYPLLGAGAGVSPDERPGNEGGLGPRVASHTEYTRLLAEHGCLGLIATIALSGMLLRAFRRASGSWPRAVTASFGVWASLFLSVSAMRLAAPAFLFGLLQARLIDARGIRSRPARLKRMRQPAFLARPNVPRRQSRVCCSNPSRDE